MIDSFHGKYRFLSNFWPAQVKYDGDTYFSVECAYQAAKSEKTDLQYRAALKDCLNSRIAKRLGKKAKIRIGWNDMKLGVMEDLVRQKFQHPTLREQLLATGDEELVECNSWKDCYWGIYKGVGENHLGKILMMVREEVRNV